MRRIIALFSISFILSLSAQAENYSWAHKYFPQYRLTSQHFGSIMTVTNDFDKPQYSVKGGSFDGFYTVKESYFQPHFGSVYREFSLMRYEFPKGHVFCRMENATCNRYNVMFSIHAGGYSER
jgi:hypothetical protein